MSCTTIQANPDIAGIGVRINLYVNALIMAIIPINPEYENTKKLREVLSGGGNVAGLALLITSIIQTAQNQLSLYHALFAIHMLYFMGIVVVPAGAYKSESAKSVKSTDSAEKAKQAKQDKQAMKIRLFMVLILVTGSIIMFTVYGLIVWAKADTFGNSPQCNSQIKYIFFFRPVPATAKWLRGIWITALVLAFCILAIYPLVKAFLRGEQETKNRNKTDQLVRFSKILFTVYGIATLELYGKQNRKLITADDQQWTFGQIMALTTLFNTLNETLHCLISNIPALSAQIRQIWENALKEPDGPVQQTPG